MALDYPVSDEAARIHGEAIVFDGHCDTLIDISEGERSFDKFEDKGDLDMPRMQAGGITAQIFAAFVRPERRKDGPAETLRMIETMYEIAETWPTQIILATRADQIRQAKQDGKIAGILGMEGADGLDGDLRILRSFYRLGVRNIGLTWNNRNLAADGVGEARTGGGLTEFGVKLVGEMRRLGIMVDIAHLAPAGVADVFRIYDGPVVASHANAKAVCGHRRNLSDGQLEQVAKSGGVVGVTYVPAFIVDQPEGEEHLLEKLLDHVDHIVKVIGIDHVGLGSDWDGIGSFGKGFFKDVSGTPLITEGLVRRGYSEGDIRKFLGENWLRVFRQVAG